MSVFKLSDWNDLIDRINKALVNCPQTTLTPVTNPHRWSVADITNAQAVLKAACPTNTFTTPEGPNYLWKQNIIDELNTAIALGCCGNACWQWDTGYPTGGCSGGINWGNMNHDQAMAEAQAECAANCPAHCGSLVLTKVDCPAICWYVQVNGYNGDPVNHGMVLYAKVKWVLGGPMVDTSPWFLAADAYLTSLGFAYHGAAGTPSIDCKSPSPIIGSEWDLLNKAEHPGITWTYMHFGSDLS